MEITFINHSTCLIKYKDKYIITDPIWSNWIGIPYIFGEKRQKEPGIKLEDIPQIDIVLISHNHFDHMDIPSLKLIRNKFHPLFLVGLGNKEFLKNKGIKNVVEFDWWENLFFNDFIIHFVPAQHWSGRMPWDIDKTLWGGFVIEDRDGAIYFSGDTAYGKFLKDIKNKFKIINLSLLPIAPYEKYMKIQHMTPEDAINAHILLNSKLSVGIHHSTFFDNKNITIKRLFDSMKTNNIKCNEFVILGHGETLII